MEPPLSSWKMASTAHFATIGATIVFENLFSLPLLLPPRFSLPAFPSRFVFFCRRQDREGETHTGLHRRLLRSALWQLYTQTSTHIHTHAAMLAYRQSGRLLRAASTRGSRTAVAARFYSAHHGEEHHGHEEHHGEEHGHDDHSLPLSESESILNSHTAKAAGIVALIVGYHTINASYEASHDGASLLSVIKAPEVLEELQANFSAYRKRVDHQQEIQEMMMFPGERRTYGRLVTSIDTIPGRYFPSGSNTQLNTITDHDALAPRKTKESPFY